MGDGNVAHFAPGCGAWQRRQAVRRQPLTSDAAGPTGGGDREASPRLSPARVKDLSFARASGQANPPFFTGQSSARSLEIPLKFAVKIAERGTIALSRHGALVARPPPFARRGTDSQRAGPLVLKQTPP